MCVSLSCMAALIPHRGIQCQWPPVSLYQSRGEASVGNCTGQPLIRKSNRHRVPTRFSTLKPTWMARYRERLKARRGRRSWYVQTLLGWAPGVLVADQWHSLLARIGKARSPSR